MRKNQKGFTLVELIIAVAILAIVTLAVCGFIVVGSRSYTSANTDIMLQQEAQLALNQISDVIIDTTDSINYGNGTETVLKDSEFSSEPDAKILVVVNKKAGNNDNDSYRFEWSKADETIYFNTSSTVIDDTNPVPVFDDANRAILAQHVKELHIDISQFEENRVVMISMTFENGNREYTTSNNVTVRNRISLNKIDIDPMKKADEFTITTVQNVTLEPGDSFDLKDKTQVDTSSDDDAVIWELVDATTTTSSITADGQLTIGVDETRKSFQVRVRRVNEEYANQNNKVAKTVKVNVKRVTSVDLSCSETSINSGSTVTVSGSANGNFLGASCEAHSCLTDDEGKDYDLTPTRWRIVRGPAAIEISDEHKAEVKIAATAAADDEIEIEAVSDLSIRKRYGEVKGTLILKVAKGATGDIPLKSGFKFGTDNDEETGMTLDYMYQEAKLPDYSHYIACVRVRELGATSAADDQVIIYNTNVGKNVRFFPDMFGLELNRSYHVFIQLLLPVSSDTVGTNGAYNQYPAESNEQIVAEYKRGVDPVTGKYTGKYPATPLYYGEITPPILSLELNGVTYPNDNDGYFETYSFPTRDQRVMNKITYGKLLNIKYQTFESLNSVKYTIYEGEGDNINNWTRVCGYNEDTKQYDSTAFPNGAISMNPYGNTTGDPFLQRDINNYDLAGTVGTYHIVPGYEYANNPNIGNYIYLLKENIHGDFGMHYYTQPDCTIHLKVTGFNLEMPREDGQERWTLFPLPTDRDFPFALGSSEEQLMNGRYFAVYSESGQKVKDLSNITVKCTYLPGAMGSKDAYKIELLSQETKPKATIYKSYGVYKCEVGGEQWDIVTPGTTREEFYWKARIYFRYSWGEDGMMEVPLPSDPDFPEFEETFTDSGNMKLYRRSDVYGEQGWTNDWVTLNYSYDADEDRYQVQMQYNNNSNMGTWECAGNGRQWKKIK